MADHPSLVEHLEAVFDEPPVGDEARDRFIVDSDEKATWAARKLARYRAEVAALEEQADREHARIDEWLRDATAGARANVQWFEQLLVGYAARLHAENPTGAKSHRFLGGKVGRRRTPDKLEVVDADVFTQWAVDAERLDLVSLKPSVSAIKRDVGESLAVSDGKVVDATSGEVVPGVVWVDGTDRYYAEVDQ